MRYRSFSEAEVEAADAMPWDGRIRNVMRPFGYRTLVRAGWATSVLLLVAAVASFVSAATASRTAGAHRAVLVGGGVFTAVLGVVFAVLCGFVSPGTVRRVGPVIGVLNIMFSPVTISLWVLASGPGLATSAAAYIEGLIFAVYMFRRRWAVLCVVLTAIAYAVVLLVQEDVSAPGTQWVIIASIVITTAVVVGGIAEASQRLTEAERQARLELAELNRALEDRVREQVDELENLGRLRRFLSPQVAEAVTSVGSPGLLEPHRRRIAVFFCDLRGFTAFTNQAEPEDVLRVLDEYYGAVGAVLQRYDATIGGYSGDGIMAYFGDPVPRDDPALDAVRMTIELRVPLDALVTDWVQRGYNLSYGVGLSYGYATLGVIGFDGRYDYTPLGSVVNLAARLCANASAAQVLLDHATYAATSAHTGSSLVADLELKGFGSATRAYALATPRD
jgi:class 3 adenylate cyclase